MRRDLEDKLRLAAVTGTCCSLTPAEARELLARPRCRSNFHPGTEPRGFRCDLEEGHAGSHQGAGREWT